MENKGDESASDSKSDEQQYSSEDEEQAQTMDGFVELVMKFCLSLMKSSNSSHAAENNHNKHHYGS